MWVWMQLAEQAALWSLCSPVCGIFLSSGSSVCPIRSTCPSHLSYSCWRDAFVLATRNTCNWWQHLHITGVVCVHGNCAPGHEHVWGAWRYMRAYPKVFGPNHNEIYAYNNKHSLRSNTKGYGGKTHQTDSQNSDTTAPSGRELYHLQFSLQGASPESFGYSLVYLHEPRH
jgi:hypothetical protein